MIEIDGSFGEGGGQVLRTSLSLSLVTGEDFRITAIRENRSRPGLMRQHLTAVQAATEIGAADVEGATIGSRELVFRPKNLLAGNYEFAVGTAGSSTLVLQTILPALLTCKKSSSITVKGGTHNPAAPPYDFIAHSFLPLLRTMGWKVESALERHGFYPAGGGCIAAHFHPGKTKSPLELNYRGVTNRVWAKVLISCLPEHIAKRELEVIGDILGIERNYRRIKRLSDDHGPGNTIVVGVESEHLTEIFCGFGEKGKKAESLAEEVALKVQKYLENTTPIGTYLADQLLLPLALSGGGSFETFTPTHHCYTNAEIIKRFLPLDIEFKELDSDKYQITLTP